MPVLQMFQVDAFTDRLFAGNPAAVVPLEAWLDDNVLQKIAAENNLSETAFFVRRDSVSYELRWFTPKIEVPLCGHATLATAFILSERLGQEATSLTFHTRQAGDVVTTKEEGGRISMRLPVRPNNGSVESAELAGALGGKPIEIVEFLASDDTSWLAVFDTEAEVVSLRPDYQALMRLPPRNIIATARGNDVDFVSRMFAPKAGIDEDPVTGSAHCSLVPFWAERLDRSEFVARQVSKRGGDLRCRLDGDFVVVSGQAVLYLEGRIAIPD